jgi:hypothetical protein
VRKTERQTETDRDRQREAERQRENIFSLVHEGDIARFLSTSRKKFGAGGRLQQY